MSHEVEYDRYNYSLRTNLVKEVLPQFFTTDYPNLVAFLNGYYEYVDSDETLSLLDDLYSIRDIERASLTQLDQIFEEIAKGASRDYFADPREVLRNFAKFYRVKGTRYSAEGFFRAFFNEDVEIAFPKENIFTLGTDSSGIARSFIGPENLDVIQNGALYQIFSVLLKSAIPLSSWRELYKRFVHPAGFYLGAEVVITGLGQFTLSAPDAVPDSAGFTVTREARAFVFSGYTNDSSSTFTPSEQHIGILPDTSDTGQGAEFINLDRRVSHYQNMTVDVWQKNYFDIKDVVKANSPRFDEDSTVTDAFAVRMSNTAEKMDRDLYSKDSANTGYVSDEYVVSGYFTPE